MNVPSESRYATNPTEIAEVMVPDLQATTVNTYHDKSAFDAFEEIRNNMGTRLEEEVKRQNDDQTALSNKLLDALRCTPLFIQMKDKDYVCEKLIRRVAMKNPVLVQAFLEIDCDNRRLENLIGMLGLVTAFDFFVAVDPSLIQPTNGLTAC